MLRKKLVDDTHCILTNALESPIPVLAVIEKMLYGALENVVRSAHDGLVVGNKRPHFSIELLKRIT